MVALPYAVVSFYWAFGGTSGIGTLGGRLEELGRNGDPVVLWLAGIAGVLKVAGAVLALAGVVEVAAAGDRAALWWHVLVWDLWFLVGGVLLGVAAWRFGRVTAPAAGGRRGGG